MKVKVLTLEKFWQGELPPDKEKKRRKLNTFKTSKSIPFEEPFLKARTPGAKDKKPRKRKGTGGEFEERMHSFIERHHREKPTGSTVTVVGRGSRKFKVVGREGNEAVIEDEYGRREKLMPNYLKEATAHQVAKDYLVPKSKVKTYWSDAIKRRVTVPED
jgi:hypothetical protein